MRKTVLSLQLLMTPICFSAWAQEILAPVPKVPTGITQLYLPGDAIGRDAVLHAEREVLFEQYPFQFDESDVEVLSNAAGVDLRPYLRRLVHKIYSRWLLSMPPGVASKSVAGTTAIRFRVNPAGQLLAITMDSSSHNDLLNRAAWTAVTSAVPFHTLPIEFLGPYLELRIHFRVNRPPATPPAASLPVTQP